MLITLDYLIKKYFLNIRGVIHIGAHYGQEYSVYAKNGVKNMVFFEPVEENYRRLMQVLPLNENVYTFKLALGNEVGKKSMYTETANSGMSCSILEPGTHLKTYPHIKFNGRQDVEMTKLDLVQIDRSLYNMINIDVQGYELEVFKGGVKTLKGIDIIYTEVNFEDVYKGCAKVEELDEFLRPYGFVRILTDYQHKTWGDALYVKYE